MNKYFFRIIGVLLLVVLSVGYCNRSEAAVCTSIGCATSKPLASIVPADKVVRCQTNDPVEKPPCALPNLEAWGDMPSYAWVQTTDGWYRKSAVPLDAQPVPSAYVPPTYYCKPKTDEQILKAKRGDDIVELWYCDNPKGVFPQYFCHAASRTPDGFWGSLLAVLSSIKPSRECSPSEKALMQELNVSKGVKITVATNGTSTTRPTYARTATNTLGTQLSLRANVGAVCGWKRLQTSTGTATNYFELYGQPGVYTLCSVRGSVVK